MDKHKKCVYNSVDKTDFKITGPVYSRNCRNSVAFHRLISNIDLGLRANSVGMQFLNATNFADISNKCRLLSFTVRTTPRHIKCM